MSEGKGWFKFKITWFWAESLVLTCKFDVCDDKCAVMHLCLEFWEMENHFNKCVLAIEKNGKSFCQA